MPSRSEALHNEHILPIIPGSQEWFAWLANIPSFTFNGQHGQHTVRRETRSGKRAYWYAYRRVGERMLKHYIGRTPALSIVRLEEIALHLTTPSVSPHKLELLVQHSLQEARPALHHDQLLMLPSEGSLLLNKKPLSSLSPIPSQHVLYPKCR